MEAKWIYNAGAPFYHPVTHELVGRDQWYQGIAHQDHENGEWQAVEDFLTENATDGFECPFCGKSYRTQKNYDAHVEKCPEKPADGVVTDDGASI